MGKYIDKDALLAEINKRITDAPINYIGHQRIWAYNDVKDIIDTLEVKEVEESFAVDRGMAQEEEKELLLKDLCARLPYGVICYWRIGSELTLNLTEYNGHLTCINKVEIEDSSEYYYYCHFNVCKNSNGNSFQNKDVPIEIVKPYLRPMSSMTEEEENEYINIDNRSYSCPMNYAHIPASDRINWLNAHHFDYNGLIPKGLAIEVKDVIYEY